jgi:hypothetical protein
MGDTVLSDVDLENKNEFGIGSENLGFEVHPVLDKHGFPLVPQPTSHVDDPLVSIKHAQIDGH